MLISLTLQITMRYLFNQPLSWSEELAITCFSWCMLLAVALGVRDGIHVRMDLLLDRLPPPLRLGLEKLLMTAIAATGSFIAWSGLKDVVDTAETNATSAAIGYPIVWLYLCAPVSGVLICLFALQELLLGSSTPLAAGEKPAEVAGPQPVPEGK